MILQLMWLAMMAGSLVYGCLRGNASQLLPAALEGTGQAISLTLRLGAGYLLFCGLMEVAKALKAQKGVERLLRPLLRHLMPYVREEASREAIALNLSMNVLGMGNAATPMGIEAMRRMDAEARLHPEVRQDMRMLLILNATSLQLLPTTVLTLRAAAGSMRVNAVVLPTFLCTAISTAVGAALGTLCRRWEVRKGTWASL